MQLKIWKCIHILATLDLQLWCTTFFKKWATPICVETDSWVLRKDDWIEFSVSAAHDIYLLSSRGGKKLPYQFAEALLCLHDCIALAPMRSPVWNPHCVWVQESVFRQRHLLGGERMADRTRGVASTLKQFWGTEGVGYLDEYILHILPCSQIPRHKPMWLNTIQTLERCRL